MPRLSRFAAPRVNAAPSSRKYPMEVIHDMRGLDMTSPYDLIEKGRTPYAKNFRLYAEDEDSRRIAVSTRKGQGFYLNPWQEWSNTGQSSVTGAGVVTIGVINNTRAMPFTPFTNTVNGYTGTRLTKIALNIRKGTGLGPVVISIHENSSGAPGRMIAESTILPTSIGSSFALAYAKFVEAPLLTIGTQYWIYIHTQDDGADGYEISTTTASALSLVSNAGIPGLTSTAYSLNFRTEMCPNFKDKGATRFAQPFGINRTLVAYDTSIYMVDDVGGTFTPIVSGLNTLATNYRFSFADGKVFWVNGYDNLMAWNGTLATDNTNFITNGDFETNATGWTSTGAATGGAVARVTSDFHAGVASLNVTASGAGTRQTTTTLSTAARSGSMQTVDFWFKGTASQTVTFGLTGFPGTNVTATGSWQHITETIKPTASAATFYVGSNTANFFIDEVKVRSNGVEQIIDADLPILSHFTFHKDRAWGVPASDPNKIVFSENPGNPSDAVDAFHQWYYAWLSVSFVYVPAPKSADAITGIVSFQDVLKILTYTNKYDLYGTDRGSLNLRQSTGSKGAVSQESILADESFVYFAAQDGFYRHNGSSDELISDKVQSEFDGISFPQNITVAKWKRQIRFYYGASASPTNTDCLLYHTVFEEWQHDTDVHTNRAIFFADGDDDRRLIEFSSLVPAIYNAEQDYNAMGKAIDFAYWMKYDSMGGPAQKKRILKYFPLIQGVDRSFVIDVDMDKDFSNSPVHNQVILTSFGAVWGAFNWGDGTLWGGSSTFKPVKLRYPGYAYYWQMRIERKGANTPVFFFGVQYSYKPKRL